MIEIPIAALLSVIGTLVFIATSLWVVYVNGELKDRGELADYNTKEASREIREIKKRLTALESRKK